jgi:hypothetical protein
MRTRLRLGAATVVALGALLLATALASPALAWDASIDVKAKCLKDGDVGVKYTVTAWEAGHAADVSVKYSVDGAPAVSRPGGMLDSDGVFKDHFVLPAGTTGLLVVKATVAWKDSDEEETLKGKVWLPKDCEHDTSTSSSIEDTTSSSIDDTTSSSVEDTTSTSEEETTTSEQEETTTSSGEEETTTSEVLGETSTTAGGQLPFTGASSGPMLLAGIGLVAGGLLFLWSSRTRNASR